MFANLLPGVRELRAPLAAGYLWLLAMWLMIQPHVPSRSHATGPLAAAYDLGDAVSVVGLGVAVSFAAYLLGALSQGAWEAPLNVVMSVWLGFVGGLRSRIRLFQTRSAWGRVDRRIRPSFESARLSSRGSRSIMTLAETVQRQQARAAQWTTPPWEDFMAEDDFRRQERRLETFNGATEDTKREGFAEGVLAGQVVDELDLVESRLMTEEPELFNAVDRLRAESEFRLAILPPLVALTIVLAIQDGPGWVFVGLPLVVFFQQAVRRLQQAGDRLADALFIQKVKAPVLERLELAATEVAKRREERAREHHEEQEQYERRDQKRREEKEALTIERRRLGQE